MNTPTITRAKRFTNQALKAAAGLGILVTLHAHTNAQADWSVDFSRRQQQSRSQELRGPASVGGELPITAEEAAAAPAPQDPQLQQQQQKPGFFESLFQPGDVAQEIVVLNTEKGFVPSTIRVKKGLNYQIHIVNVNDKEKNVSFVLDSFSEHHATYYGKLKSFVIRPQKEGVYKFVSPETSAQGKLVVIPSQATDNRMPASAE